MITYPNCTKEELLYLLEKNLTESTTYTLTIAGESQASLVPSMTTLDEEDLNGST